MNRHSLTDPTQELRAAFLAALLSAAERIPVLYVLTESGNMPWLGWTDDPHGPEDAGYWIGFGLGMDPDLLPYQWRTFLTLHYLPYVPDDEVRRDDPRDVALDLGYFAGLSARDPELLADLVVAAALSHRRRHLPHLPALPIPGVRS